MPPNRVELWTCASLAYGNGAISWLKYSTIADARRNEAAALSALSGKSQVVMSTQRPSLKHGRPTVVTRNSAAPITMLYGEIGVSILQRNCLRGIPSVDGTAEGWPSRRPLATTSQPAGATTVNDAVALSAGWSSAGNQKRARLGQLSANAARWPCTLFRTINPSSGVPRYATAT